MVRKTVSRGPETGQHAEILASAEPRGSRGRTKVYPGSPPVRALDQVSLAVTAGELAAIVGPSGSGKSSCCT